jgi:hypothetical protein
MRFGTAVQVRRGVVSCGVLRFGSRGTDVMGRVGYGAAGSLQWTGEIGYERSVKGQAGICRGAAGRVACGV